MKNDEKAEIYVHIPFCVKKCDYCDFVSFACGKDVQEDYFKALLSQIESMKETVGSVPIVSCFFGGGTPTVPDERLLISVLCKLKETFNFTPDAEITIEANPNSASREKLRAYRDAGVNRLSIGLQSTDNGELKCLSRLHTYEEFLKTFKDAREAGFDNINVDIMSALPGQTMESFEKTLERVCALNPEHISAYSLIIEEGTPFFDRYKDGKGLPDEDTEREMYYLTKRFLHEHGYERYEISNYSKPGYECKHNLGYWERVPYYGFGIAAASFYGGKRFQMHNDLKRFIKGDYEAQIETLSRDEEMSEFMFLGLRLTKGVSAQEFYEKFGVNIDEVYGAELSKLKAEGLINTGERISLTDKGMDVANYCMSEFIR
ncbi:MAG: oxygen-independent coproporphyrinogen III oxidase [Lachnospiraceae bacterium]|nr:oxygen-independent coproporphyrinogen III oxidase [Lachnospiraceae bacterium]